MKRISSISGEYNRLLSGASRVRSPGGALFFLVLTTKTKNGKKNKYQLEVMTMTKCLFLGAFEDMSVDQVVEMTAKEFEEDKGSLAPYEFLVAYMSHPDYSMDAYYLLRHRETGDYYEVCASHCSCNGFEEQWDLKLASPTYLLSAHYNQQAKIKNFVHSLFN